MVRYLDGERVTPISAPNLRKLIGREVKYLRDVDIDHTGRGFFFPRVGVIQDVHRREFFDGGDWVHMGDIVEMVLLEQEDPKNV